jgi:hypothetical protein
MQQFTCDGCIQHRRPIRPQLRLRLLQAGDGGGETSEVLLDFGDDEVLLVSWGEWYFNMSQILKP